MLQTGRLNTGKVTEEQVRALLSGNDCGYRRLNDCATELGRVGNFEAIGRLLTHVREVYPKVMQP